MTQISNIRLMWDAVEYQQAFQKKTWRHTSMDHRYRTAIAKIHQRGVYLTSGDGLTAPFEKAVFCRALKILHTALERGHRIGKDDYMNFATMLNYIMVCTRRESIPISLPKWLKLRAASKRIAKEMENGQASDLLAHS